MSTGGRVKNFGSHQRRRPDPCRAGGSGTRPGHCRPGPVSAGRRTPGPSGPPRGRTAVLGGLLGNHSEVGDWAQLDCRGAGGQEIEHCQTGSGMPGGDNPGLLRQALHNEPELKLIKRFLHNESPQGQDREDAELPHRRRLVQIQSSREARADVEDRNGNFPDNS